MKITRIIRETLTDSRGSSPVLLIEDDSGMVRVQRLGLRSASERDLTIDEQTIIALAERCMEAEAKAQPAATASQFLAGRCPTCRHERQTLGMPCNDPFHLMQPAATGGRVEMPDAIVDAVLEAIDMHRDHLPERQMERLRNALKAVGGM